MTETIVIGGGFGGVAVARALKRAGHDDFLVLDAQADLGGVWRHHRYPGCAADMPGYLYAFSDAVPRAGDRLVPSRNEILAYLDGVVRDEGLAAHFRFGQPIARIVYDNRARRWTISAANGNSFDARFVIVATGTTGLARYPEIPGLADFAGPAVHTMDWPEDLDWRGRDIVMIGAGASAIQLVPRLADGARSLTVLSRSHRWILPKPDFRVGTGWRATFDRLGGVRQMLGKSLAAYVDRRARMAMFASPRKLAEADRQYRARMTRHIGEWSGDLPLPATPFGCTRTLFSNDYFSSFQQPHVRLGTEPASILADAVVDTGGTRHPAQLIVFATGADRFHRSLTIIRPDGSDLYRDWQAQPAALAGIFPADAPNLFHLSGPNSGVLNAAPRLLEIQAALAVRLIKAAIAADGAIAATPAQVAAFQQALRPRLDATIWKGDYCDAWYTRTYRDNPVIWPDSLAAYRRMAESLNPHDLLIA